MAARTLNSANPDLTVAGLDNRYSRQSRVLVPYVLAIRPTQCEMGSHSTIKSANGVSVIAGLQGDPANRQAGSVAHTSQFVGANCAW